MNTPMLKRCGLLCLPVAAMLCMAVLSGCPTNCPAYQPGQNEIRGPAGGQNPNAFWNAFDWADMTAAEQALWGVLGWNQANWDGSGAPPASEDKWWSELSDQERSAAVLLGYNQASWDGSA